MRALILSIVLVFLGFVPLYSQQGRVPTKPTEPVRKFVPEAVPAGKAIIYLFRVDELDVQALPLVFTRQGVLGILPAKSYYRVLADPGKITFWFAEAVSKELQFDVEVNAIYYVKVDNKPKFLGGATPEIEANLLKTTDPTPPKELDGSSQLEGPDE